MADYAKKTVAELQEILKSRGLPSSGKKAELVARLNENDAAATAEPEPITAPEPEPEPEVVEPAPTTATPVAANPTPSTTEPPTDPTSTATDQPSPDTTLANQTNYSLNLPTSAVDTELAKRKARAARFGTAATAAPSDEATEPTASAEALRNLERAKRFGTGETAINKLDEALPSEQARSRKRGHAAVEATELDDPGLKKSFANRGRGRGGRFAGKQRGGGGGGRGNAGAARPQGVQKGGAPAYVSEKDKLAAEARRKKFATA